MADYAIFKGDDTVPGGLLLVAVVSTDKVSDYDGEKLARSVYGADGRYAVVRWDNRDEFDLTAGPPAATEVEEPTLPAPPVEPGPDPEALAAEEARLSEQAGAQSGQEPPE